MKLYKAFHTITSEDAENMNLQGPPITVLRGYTNHSELSGLDKILFAGINKRVFKCILSFIPEVSHSYIPGFIHRNNKFYKAPLIIKYIEFVSATFSNDTNIKFKIFLKDFSDFKEIELTPKLGSLPHEKRIDFIQNLINLFNKLVEQQIDINIIDNSKISENILEINYLNYNIISRGIQNISIKAFENCMSHVGKDNSFWTEYELKNLPKIPYIILLFKKVLSQYYRVYEKDYGLLVVGESSKFWAEWHPRRAINEEGDIKQILLYEAKANINHYHALLTELGVPPHNL